MIVSRAPTRCGKEHVSLRVRHHQQLARSARARAHANVYVRRPARTEPSRSQTGCGRSGAAQPPTVRAPGALEADRSEAQSRSRPSVNTGAAARGRALLQRPDHQARRHLAGVGQSRRQTPAWASSSGDTMGTMVQQSPKRERSGKHRWSAQQSWWTYAGTEGPVVTSGPEMYPQNRAAPPAPWPLPSYAASRAQGRNPRRDRRLLLTPLSISGQTIGRL